MADVGGVVRVAGTYGREVLVISDEAGGGLQVVDRNPAFQGAQVLGRDAAVHGSHAAFHVDDADGTTGLGGDEVAEGGGQAGGVLPHAGEPVQRRARYTDGIA